MVLADADRAFDHLGPAFAEAGSSLRATCRAGAGRGADAARAAGGGLLEGLYVGGGVTTAGAVERAQRLFRLRQRGCAGVQGLQLVGEGHHARPGGRLACALHGLLLGDLRLDDRLGRRLLRLRFRGRRLLGLFRLRLVLFGRLRFLDLLGDRRRLLGDQLDVARSGQRAATPGQADQFEERHDGAEDQHRHADDQDQTLEAAVGFLRQRPGLPLNRLRAHEPPPASRCATASEILAKRASLQVAMTFLIS